ncbi:anti-sigma factor domain-containing protein [Tessaracoccus sp. Y36]
MTTHLENDQLLSLALAEDDTTDQYAAHLASCPRCNSAVADLRLGAQLVRDAQGSPSLAATPPPRLRARVLEASDAPATAGTTTSGLRSRSWPWVLAAAVCLMVGVGLGTLLELPSRDAAPVTVASAELAPLADDATPAAARLVDGGDGLVLVVEAPVFDAKEADYFEVWLINEDLQRMVSVGILEPDGEQRFPVTQRLLDEGYTIVDISRELFDDAPTHSGDSLVRGELTD